MWLTESNRKNHLLYAIPCGFVGTILLVLGLALGMEYKDKMYGNKFDWLDVAATMIGGAIGQVLQAVVVTTAYYGFTQHNDELLNVSMCITVIVLFVVGLYYIVKKGTA